MVCPPPWEQPIFKATMGGIKRDIGGKAKKKPLVEAWHIAELLSWDTRPANWTPQMWWQGKAMLLCGFQLFNRPAPGLPKVPALRPAIRC